MLCGPMEFMTFIVLCLLTIFLAFKVAEEIMEAAGYKKSKRKK